MMSMQLGETFSGFNIQRPVQGVLLTQSPLLFKYHDYELPKIFVPPPPPRARPPPSF